MSDLFKINNNGPEIVETNFFTLPQAKEGLLYLSWNAGAGRLLVPQVMAHYLSEMKTGKEVIITQGIMHGRDMLEIMFNDNTESPFFVFILSDCSDRILSASDVGPVFDFTVWTEGGKQFSFIGRYRIGKLPNGLPWSD